MHPIVQGMMSLFEGYKKAYGYYSGNLTADDGGKMTGKRGSITGDVTIELWEKHIAGEQGLGIVPIDETSRVKFAAVDIDVYPLDIVKLAHSVRDLPVIVCRTKSGGAHLYLFLKDWHSAGEVQRKLREIASSLGYGGCEIYPKQSQIVADRGDVGNWINMPYFHASKSTRYALSSSGKELSVAEFIDFALVKSISPADFLQIHTAEIEHLEGGPPCLNHLISLGFPKGTRNNGLLNMGVYAKKINPDNWEPLVEEMNRKYMDPPLEASEVMGVIKSLQKKDFFYMCKQPPIAQYCNAIKCRLCKFGIGNSSVGMPKFGTLTKLLTVPPIWFLEIEGGGRLELSTNDLQSQRAFQNRCMEVLNIMPIPPKNEIWQEIVSELLTKVNEVQVPIEATPQGLLKQHLEDFCTSRVQAKVPEEILLGKPYTDNRFHYFRMKDFMEFVDRKKFNYMSRSQIVMYLQDWGAKTKFWNLRGKGVNTYMFPEITNKQTESFDAPNQKKEVPY